MTEQEAVMLNALKRAAHAMAEVHAQHQSKDLVAARVAVVEAIKAIEPEYYGTAT